ncbi:MAG: Ig-like domain-containing protein [Chitinophagales bacterium]|nr:Ig-like domain-containing protein [Chitinophagales bacterium]MBP8753064.1 Ig-like domain-containing protein [Chitinophagales bacterium]MBP9189056.1 Ig-like domain-containing protein [Chitinophagales bacterium]MBP9548381.1 Ig-like domain-containing protein [Chitinophagales bacterium]MBP9703497.1 Ig-like domain-containing protein [Chitinophagales bacterium]
MTPQGGKKDTTPPQVLNYQPENESVNFEGKTIQILFDEYIQTSDLFNQVIISPPMNNMPEFKIKGKKLIINILDDLRDSTTYTINFGSGIKDNTESNTLENFTYVFSTGDQLDSLQVVGNIINIITGRPEKNSVAVLYPDFIDSSFQYSKPWYFAKADANGDFTIPNIKSGKYQLYGLTDQNFNYYYDLPNELIAFIDTAITPDSINQSYQLQLFSENHIPQQLLEAKSLSYASSRLAFSKSIDNTTIEYNSNLLKQSNITNDTIFFWSSDTVIKQHNFQIKYDSIDTSVIVQLKSFPSENYNHKNIISTNYYNIKKPINNIENPYLLDINKPLEIISTFPIQNISHQLMNFFEDTLPNPISATFALDTLLRDKITTSLKFLPNKQYQLVINKGAITDIFDSQNDSLIIFFKTRSAEDYGNLKIKIKTTITYPIILELLKDDFTIVRNEYILSPDDSEIQMQYLLPGTYNLRIRIDQNHNQKWDTGNLKLLQQPEPIIFYKDPLPIRANWDQTIEWKLEH